MYVSLNEIKNYLNDPVMDDTKAQYLYDSSATILHTACRVTTFDDEVITEYHDYSFDDTYMLKSHVRDVVSIGGVAVTSDDYFIKGRRITTDKGYEADKRWRVAIVYNAGFLNTPWDIKSCILSLCAYCNTQSKSQGISSYTQGDVSITYSTQDQEQKMILSSVVWKYWFIDVIAI